MKNVAHPPVSDKLESMKSLIIIFSSLLLLVSPSMADWPFWRGDLAGSGITPETNLPTKWDKKKKAEEEGNSH